jgi:hypothetical protein
MEKIGLVCGHRMRVELLGLDTRLMELGGVFNLLHSMEIETFGIACLSSFENACQTRARKHEIELHQPHIARHSWRHMRGQI